MPREASGTWWIKSDEANIVCGFTIILETLAMWKNTNMPGSGGERERKGDRESLMTRDWYPNNLFSSRLTVNHTGRHELPVDTFVPNCSQENVLQIMISFFLTIYDLQILCFPMILNSTSVTSLYLVLKGRHREKARHFYAPEIQFLKFSDFPG